MNVIHLPWMLSRRILRWRLAPPFPRPCLWSVRRWPERLNNNNYYLPCHLFHGQTLLIISLLKVKNDGSCSVEKVETEAAFDLSMPPLWLCWISMFVDRKNARSVTCKSASRLYKVEGLAWLVAHHTHHLHQQSNSKSLYRYQWLVQSRQLASPPVVSSFVIVLNIELDHWRWIGRQSAP